MLFKIKTFNQVYWKKEKVRDTFPTVRIDTVDLCYCSRDTIMVVIPVIISFDTLEKKNHHTKQNQVSKLFSYFAIILSREW